MPCYYFNIRDGRTSLDADGTVTTIEGSAEMADLEKWSGQQLATH